MWPTAIDRSFQPVDSSSAGRLTLAQLEFHNSQGYVAPVDAFERDEARRGGGNQSS